jgi:hypothetical protein
VGVGNRGVTDAEEVYLMALGKLDDLVVGAEFVAFVEGIGETRENY